MKPSVHQRIRMDLGIKIDEAVTRSLEEVTGSTSPMFRKSSGEILETNVAELATSLLLIRSTDAFIARSYMSENFQSGVWRHKMPDLLAGPANRVDISDLRTALVTMECPCPMLVECCPKIVENPLSFLIVFQEDRKIISSADLDVAAIARLGVDEIEKRLLVGISRETEIAQSRLKNRSVQSYRRALSSKAGLWHIGAEDVVVPLVEAFRQRT